ncbi:methyl-accepting chemotaxis protein [Herbaspirillum sp. YR522]|uniref:methyl-accepting chemotaxis protein n=1 Tax=Herbaspirillum sp. YR522 TaxID=1144342 RepID=UPI00026FCD68|nr:methyl-accepting chemotaxis protein [Herbaspirillum sp. YR522]EJN02585.1 methyl-accepting chemotaxis protein [Herbaspirillum sp. YR522]
MPLQKMRLKYRFVSLCAVLAAGFAAYGAWSFKTLGELKVNGPLYREIVKGKDLIADIMPPPQYIIESYLVALDLTIAPPGERAALVKKLKSLKSDYDQRYTYWANQDVEPALKQQLLDTAGKPAQAFYRIAFERLLPALEQGDQAEVAAAFEQLKNQYERHRQAITALVELSSTQNARTEAEAAQLLDDANTIMLLILLGAMGLAVATSAAIARSILHQVGGELTDASQIAGQIAAGDMTAQVKLRAGDKSSVMAAMKQMCESLSGIVGQVRTSSQTIAATSSQIAAGNLDLSARTEQQAGALEKTATSMEQVTATVRQNADHARKADLMANSAYDIAAKGGAIVGDVVHTMESINQSARKIGDIISVIDSIAFQTNILALNAAVEAARAGAQGRGFAVVAAEVRGLAQHSANAAREVKALIDQSLERVNAGSDLVSQAGTTMEQIVFSVRSVTQVIGQITLASNEQLVGIEQVNQAISQIDAVTQQNTALVEEAAGATCALRDEAQQLTQTVALFKLDDARGPVGQA